MKLMRAPKFALVVGNRSYKRSPLRNPANDARSIGELLKAVGFDVTLKLDASRTELEAAVQGYLKLLAARKGVGLFYYAGHGVQLAWRNYMLPVDIDVRALDDIPKQGGVSRTRRVPRPPTHARRTASSDRKSRAARCREWPGRQRRAGSP